MIISTIEGLSEYVGVELKSLKDAIFKDCDCGPYVEWDNEGVTIGSYAEDGDTVFEKTLGFPFGSEDYEDWLNELEELCGDARSGADSED